MISRTTTVANTGLVVTKITVETDLRGGFPGFTIVGLADTGVQEAKERIRSACKNADLPFPSTYRITVNLAPATIRKAGPLYDLPIAVSILLPAMGIPYRDTGDSIFLGELALDGSTRYTDGILPALIGARAQGIHTAYIPAANRTEAAYIPDMSILPVSGIGQLMEHLAGKRTISPIPHTPPQPNLYTPSLDISMIHGQYTAKRALEIAAVGKHNLFMSGPPGTGKTTLVRALATVLPPLSHDEALEVTQLHALAGLTSQEAPIITQPPFRAPHHSASTAALLGGGQHLRPGEIALAHRGVLFLDELPEFNRNVLEVLRQPMEDGTITIARSHTTRTYPAACMVIAAQNPCPCGYADDPDTACTCSAARIDAYRKKISGPLLDRFDMHVRVVRLHSQNRVQESESSQCVRERVSAARAFRAMRSDRAATTPAAQILLDRTTDMFHLSFRAHYRIMRIARTIADLAASPDITEEHMLEAVQLRMPNTIT